MLKKHSIVFLFLFLTRIGQCVDFSLKLGGNYSTFWTVGSVGKIERSFGGGLYFPLSPRLSLGIEVLNSQRTAIIEKKIIGGWPREVIEYWDLYCSINYWQIPILLKYNAFKYNKLIIDIHGGVDFSIARNDKSYRFNEEFIDDIGDDKYWENTFYDYKYVYDGPDVDRMIAPIYKSSGLGYFIGFSSQWSRLFFEIRFLIDQRSVQQLFGRAESVKYSYGDLYELNERLHSIYFLVGYQIELK